MLFEIFKIKENKRKRYIKSRKIKLEQKGDTKEAITLQKYSKIQTGIKGSQRIHNGT